ncbi:MAG: hypothetical protein E7258_08265 [Lachnospiraceae bacterium]|nr:hypothetical protein [Lachnospiraceae bacterium]
MHRYKIIKVLITLWICMLTGCSEQKGVFVAGEAQTEDTSVDISSEENITAEVVWEEVAVYVCGAVKAPGVYYLSVDSIKQDALDAAGGFIDGASLTYVNLAEKVKEGEQIYFPFEEELSAGYTPIEGRSDGKININTATVDILMTLPGIGESKAKAIVDYREEHGDFQSTEDIIDIPGIKEGIYNNIKDYIVVN